MPAARKTTISLSLLSIPVSLHSATRDNDIHFNQLHKSDHKRIRHKKVCAHCGKEVRSEDIVRGYQYDEGHFVIITDEDLEQIRTDQDRTIQILHFVDLESLSPVYFDRPFHAVPETGGDKAFELLRAALLAEDKVAIGRAVFGYSETLLCIIPHEEGLLIETLFFDEEVTELPKSYQKPALTREELTLARRLVDSMSGPFDLSTYHDEYQERLRELIESKLNGRELVRPTPKPPENVVDLMEALRRSVLAEGGEEVRLSRGARSAKAGKSKSPRGRKSSAGKGA